jgi:hypothetical protein
MYYVPWYVRTRVRSTYHATKWYSEYTCTNGTYKYNIISQKQLTTGTLINTDVYVHVFVHMRYHTMGGYDHGTCVPGKRVCHTRYHWYTCTMVPCGTRVPLWYVRHGNGTRTCVPFGTIMVLEYHVTPCTMVPWFHGT